MKTAVQMRDNVLKFYEKEVNDMMIDILDKIEQLSLSGHFCYSFEFTKHEIRTILIDKFKFLGYSCYVSGRSNEKLTIGW